MQMRLRQWFRQLTGSDTRYAQKFLAQYRGRTLIVHQGLTLEWLRELLSVGGGGAHFRVDLRHTDARAGSPLAQVIHRHILPLQLPLPLLLDVHATGIGVRHLQRFGMMCLPTDIAWIVEDMRVRNRVHAYLRVVDGRLVRTVGIAVDDNRYELDDGTTV